MASGGVGINVGDAVLNFVADTTQLDQAYAKVGAEATAKLAPVKAAADQVSASLEKTGVVAAAASQQMIVGFQSVTREGQTWANFFKVNMPAAVAYTGSATEAMKLLGAEWKRFQASQTDGFHVITREGQLWAGFFKANIDQAIKYTGSATAAMKLLGVEWQKLKLETAQGLNLGTAGGTGIATAEQEIAAAKEQTAVVAKESAEQIVAANTEVTTSESKVAGAVEQTGAIAVASGAQVAESATLWQRLVAVLRQVMTGGKAVEAQLVETSTASSAAAIAAEQQSEAYQTLVTAQLELREAQLAVQTMLRQLSTGEIPKTTRSIQELAAAQQLAATSAEKLAVAESEVGGASVNIREAKGEVMLLNHELGLGVDRHIAGYIAKLPVVGALLEAAFAATAVLIIIQLLVEGIEKLDEWLERGEKIRQAWAAIDEEFAKTTDGIKESINDQEQKFIELTEGPVAALDFAFKHMKSTAQDTLQSITSETQKASDQLKSQSGFFSFLQDFSFKDASKSLNAFVTDLTEGMRKAKEANPGDVLAQYREGQKLTETEITKLNEKLAETKARIDEATAAAKANGGQAIDIVGISQDLEPLQKELDILNKINGQLKEGIDLDNQRAATKKQEEATAAAQRAQELGTARIDAEKETGQAIIALREEQNTALYQQGQRSYAAYIALTQKNKTDEYNLEKTSLERKIALLQADPVKNESQIIATNGRILTLEKQHQLDMLKIDEDTYKKNASDYIAAAQQLIATTRQGSQERVNLETALAAYLKLTYGAESDAYRQQLQKSIEAERQHTDQLARIAIEQSRVQQQLFQDRQQAASQYYQYEAQTARINQVTLLALQHEYDVNGFNARRADLVKQLNAIAADEVESKIRLQGQLDLLDQQRVEKERQYRVQLADVQDTYFQELGIKSEDQMNREVEIQQQAYDKIAAAGTSTYAEILRAKEALLNSKISLAQLLGDQEEFSKLTAQLGQVEAALYKMGIVGTHSYASIGAAMDAFAQRLVKQRGTLTGTQAVFDTVMTDMTSAMASAVSAWILGQASLGQALRQGLAAELATIAGKAAAWALYFTAWGIADIFWNPARAASDFTAAATFAAVAALAGASAYAIRPGKQETQEGLPTTTQAPGITQGPTQQQNVTRLGMGGVVSRRQLVLIGDDASGASSAKEAVLPLESPAAMKTIADALGPFIGARAALLSSPSVASIGSAVADQHARVNNEYSDSSTVTHQDNRTTTVIVQGLISDDKMTQVVHKINRLVKRNDVQLTASNALRVTKKA